MFVPDAASSVAVEKRELENKMQNLTAGLSQHD
jgi:hypothetical protein